MGTNYFQRTLQKRRAQLAKESINQVKDKPEFVAVITDTKIIEDELSHIFCIDTIHEVHQRFLTTGHPFRFCHVLLMSYFIAYQDDEKLKGAISPPEEWPPLISADYLLEVVEMSNPTD